MVAYLNFTATIIKFAIAIKNSNYIIIVNYDYHTIIITKFRMAIITIELDTSEEIIAKPNSINFTTIVIK